MRILFVTQGFESFVREDVDHLRSFADVETFQFDVNKGSRGASALAVASEALRQRRWLAQHLPGADAVYGWFADSHMALPTRAAAAAGVPVLVAIAGFDAIALPELGYGVYESWRAPLARYVLRNATHVVPCDETMIAHENRYSAYPDRLANGVRAHVPGFETPYTVIPFGFDPSDWRLGPAERPAVVCTVGHLGRERVQRRKGLDVFVAAARHLPDVTFQIVGVPDADAEAVRQRYEAGANVEILPPRPREELADLYANASVYAQLSRAEGQPNVLGEAMCSGCIPVGSPVFGIPGTIGDTGYVVESPEPRHVADVIYRALHEATPERRAAARNRVIEQYSRAARRKRLRALVERVAA
ncbi:MAG TPA: glycosyltransferase [Bacteroidetes bacterium]|nr:glycosyltransferase [Bacteroidota bacterium]HIL56713.1 glycosyltransferase [Rhodothermales bacterium]